MDGVIADSVLAVLDEVLLSLRCQTTLTPLMHLKLKRAGRLMPFLWALRFWLWQVWFFDLAIIFINNKSHLSL